MAKDIVPIELGLPSGDVTTLWAPSWHEGDDDWEAFLGLDEDLYVFPATANLIAFVRSGAQHDLDDHPGWEAFAASGPLAYRADESDTFDLVGVLELLGDDPTPASVDEVDQCFSIARSIGEVCELDVVTKFFNGHPALATVTRGIAAFDGRDGLKIWKSIRKTVHKGWDDVLDAIEGVTSTPDVDAKAVATADADLAAAEAAVPAPEPEPEAAETGYPEGSLWEKVGIDPVRLVFDDRDLVTLRCFLGDRPVFLGGGGKVYAFPSNRALGRYLADHDDETLSRVSTYDRVKVAATDGSLDVHVTDDNVYAFVGLDKDIEAGPSVVDAGQLGLAVELVSDLAAYVDDPDLARAVEGKATPLRRYIRFVTSPNDAELLEPTPPFDGEAAEWRELVAGVTGHVTTPDAN